MTDLELIESSPGIQMELSELLSKALGLGCWHEKYPWRKDDINPQSTGRIRTSGCLKCKGLVDENPNLFSDWTGFGIVWKAVKDREDWQGVFSHHDVMIQRNDIATPYFQLKVALWLDKEGVERILERGRGE